MGISSLSKEKVLEMVKDDINCCQCVFGEWVESFEFDKSSAYRMTAGFGGGMNRGDTCGAVSGAVMTLGLAYGDDKALLNEKISIFQNEFQKRFGSTICRELLSYDFSFPGELQKAKLSGEMTEKCPGYIVGALEILDDIISNG